MTLPEVRSSTPEKEPFFQDDSDLPPKERKKKRRQEIDDVLLGRRNPGIARRMEWARRSAREQTGGKFNSSSQAWKRKK